MLRRRAADHLVASEARLERRNPGLARDGHRAVTVQARDPVLTGVDVVTKEDWLTGARQPPRVADDGSFVRWRRLAALCHGRGEGGGDGHGYRGTHPGPTPPLRHQSRTIASVSRVYVTTPAP